MGIRFGIARGISSALTWGLSNIAHRPAANMPGKIALYADPNIMAHARGRLREGSIVVVGTNGKTTVTNLIADCVEKSGRTVICNRTGANLDSGVASALLQTRCADWGVFESDELWLAKILPGLRPKYVLLLNLFRDQLDRCGEIDIIQDSIVQALVSSPESVLVYNGDDPLCAMVAERAAATPERVDVRNIAFGVSECMNLAQNVVSDSNMCQRCSGMLEYSFRQYGQLGNWKCPNCGFARPSLDFWASDVAFDGRGLSFCFNSSLLGGLLDGFDGGSPSAINEGSPGGSAGDLGESNTDKSMKVRASSDANVGDSPEGRVESNAIASFKLHANLSGHYMVYNMLAVAGAASLLQCNSADIQQAIDNFDPKNGRLQDYVIGGRKVLLNLAKNPTGFNQNLRIVAENVEDDKPRAAAFFINDKEADGHDISWIWDIDFEELASIPNLRVFAGGIRRNDLQVRLKYAGIDAELIDSVQDVFTRTADTSHADIYVIANYTALAPVKRMLDELAKGAAGTIDAAGAEDASLAAVDAAGGAAAGVVAASGAGATDSMADSTVAASDAGVTDSATGDSPDSSTDSAVASSTVAGTSNSNTKPVVIAHMFPDLLNLYGDGGNVRILEQRLRWRKIPVEIRRVEFGDTINFDDIDVVFLGGGPDREQALAADQLMQMCNELAEFAHKGGPILAICGGYQILGRTWLKGSNEAPGLGILDIETRRPGTSKDRIVGNVALKSQLASQPVVGYENHASRTYLDEGISPFGQVISHTGKGNNDDSHADGTMNGNIIGTYLHGPLLSKNPEVADWILERALEHHAKRCSAASDAEASGGRSRENQNAVGTPSTDASSSNQVAESFKNSGNNACNLPKLDDSVELAANKYMAQKLI